MLFKSDIILSIILNSLLKEKQNLTNDLSKAVKYIITPRHLVITI